MATVRSSGNKTTELKLIQIFRHFGIKGWRRNQRLHGKPDFVFKTARVVVFVDGCFWHGCPEHLRQPVDNRQYWKDKISRNIQRDRTMTKKLQRLGWIVLRLWEHDLQNADKVFSRLNLALARDQDCKTKNNHAKPPHAKIH